MDDDAFRPAWWLPGGHLQTIWPTLVRRVKLTTRRQRYDLPDGDFVDVDWVGEQHDDQPIVILLHGLEGSIQSSYVRGLLAAIDAHGWRGGVLHFRGCSGEPNRLPRGYHSGDTADLAWFIDHLRRKHPASKLAAVGYSLGGNVLLKWLGETGGDNPLTAAVAVSVPFDLNAAATRLEHGISRIYQRHLLTRLHASVRAKMQRMTVDLPITSQQVSELNTFRAFDDAITAPLHGFAGVDDYYTRSSSGQYIPRIDRPTLILHARNDPFMTPEAIPSPADLPDGVQLEVSPGGGHVGFVAGRCPWRATYWLEHRIPRYLDDHL
ncbi:hydrolase [Planctomycetales bacterium ZRK34]|nr:hydrolase [Planctomycetales bacterium ZRK34]